MPRDLHVAWLGGFASHQWFEKRELRLGECAEVWELDDGLPVFVCVFMPVLEAVVSPRFDLADDAG